jgi:hypothetical protein
MLFAASVLFRPLFSLRYVAPSAAVSCVMIAAIVGLANGRVRNLVSVGLCAFLVMFTPLTYAAEKQPWRQIANEVSRSSESETVFFETGFFSSDKLISEAESGGFPEGFFRVPFDYYYGRKNPRVAIPGAEPAHSRAVIAKAALRDGGAWLISGKGREAALAELPTGEPFLIDYDRDFSRVLLFHVRAIPR